MTAGNLIDHLSELWKLADEATSIFVAGGGIGLTRHDEAHLETASDRALDGLRHAALLAGRDRDASRWLPTALELGELAVRLIQTTAHSGRPHATIPGRPDLPHQIELLAPRSAVGACSLVASICARGAIATDGHPRFVETAQQLLASAGLHPEEPSGPLSWWTAQLQHTTEQLLGHLQHVPRTVAASIAPATAALVIADPTARAHSDRVTSRIPGATARNLIGSRTHGHWTIPAAPTKDTDRLIALLPPELVGPFRAVTLDREAAVCKPADRDRLKRARS